MFYESDCQEQTSPFLMTQLFFSGQSALSSSPTPRSCAACVGVEQFSCVGVEQSSLSSFPCRLERLDGSELDEYQALRSREANHGSIRDSAQSRPNAFSGSARGPMVVRVPRPDCWPGGTLGTRLPLAPSSRILEPPARNEPHTADLGGPDVSLQVSSSSSHQSALPFSTVAG